MAQEYTSDVSRSRADMDAPNLSPVTPAEDARTIMINSISWGAVLAGVVVMLVVQLLINMIGVGIGASTLDPGTGDNPSAASFSIGAGLWFLIAGILASLAGGYAAGRLSGRPKDSTAGWHGITTWAVATLVIFYLLTSSLGGLLGGAYRTMTGVVGGAASTVGATAQTAAETAAPGLGRLADPFSSIEDSLRSVTGGTDPEALRNAAVAAVRAAVTGDEAQATQAREAAAQAISQARQQPIEQARTEVQGYEDQYRQTVAAATAQATEAADVAASAVSRGALFGAIGLILGAIAAWFGGRKGAVEPTVTAYQTQTRQTIATPKRA